MRSLLPVAALALALALILIMSGCTADPTPRLSFATHLSVNPGDETVVVGEVRNSGWAPVRTLGILEGVLQVHDERGALVACAAVPELRASVVPGGSDFPLRWQGRLEPGRYELTWGAPDFGGVRSSFVLVESENGLRVERSGTTRLQGVASLTTCDAAGALPGPGAQ